MRNGLFVLTFALIGCAAAIPRLSQPWVIEGRVVAETDGKPIAFKSIDLERFESRNLILGGHFPFVSVQTDVNGKFFISGVVAGDFALRSVCPSVFGGLFEPLGQLKAGQHIAREFVFHTCLPPAR
jgi:hypothetical protein